MARSRYERFVHSFKNNHVVKRLTWNGQLMMMKVRGSVRLAWSPNADELQQLADAKGVQPGSLTIERKGRRGYRIY